MRIAEALVREVAHPHALAVAQQLTRAILNRVVMECRMTTRVGDELRAIERESVSRRRLIADYLRR